jgi:hypothetical protein
MEIRSVFGFFMLYPLVRMNGGFATMWTSRPLQHIGRNLVHYAARLGAALILAGNLLNLRAADPVPARAGAWRSGRRRA